MPIPNGTFPAPLPLYFGPVPGGEFTADFEIFFDSYGYPYAASGGATAGGAAITTFPHSYTGTGGATSGGAATTDQDDIYSYTGTGGATAGGAATTNQNDIYSYTGTGGATSGGAATILFSIAPGLNFALTATTQRIHAVVTNSING